MYAAAPVATRVHSALRGFLSPLKCIFIVKLLAAGGLLFRLIEIKRADASPTQPKTLAQPTVYARQKRSRDSCVICPEFCGCLVRMSTLEQKGAKIVGELLALTINFRKTTVLLLRCLFSLYICIYESGSRVGILRRVKFTIRSGFQKHQWHSPLLYSAGNELETSKNANL
jgi:hypothetical protein